MTHVVDKDGLCEHSELPPGQCSGCCGTDPVPGHRPHGETVSSCDPWTREDNERVLAQSVPDRQLAEELGRSENAIWHQRARLSGRDPERPGRKLGL